MASRRWILDIYNRGVTATTGTIAYTIKSSAFRDAPTVGGQLVRPVDCTVESNPWRVSIVDVGSTFTAKLADANGRLHLLGRMCRLRASLNSTATSAYTAVTVGRLTDLALNPDVASWDLDISDERWIERQVPVFTKNDSCALIPFGAISTFQGVPGILPAKWTVIQKIDNVVCLRYDGSAPIRTDPGMTQLILGDERLGAAAVTTVTTGNFNTLRFKNTGSGTAYEIAAFGWHGNFTGTGPFRPQFPTSPSGWWANAAMNLADKSDVPAFMERFYLWLVWTTSPPSLDTTVTGYLYAPTHEPTEDFPHFIGGSTGLRPFTLTRQIYAGTHSASTALLPRYSTARFTALEASDYGLCWYQAHGPEPMADFLNERIYNAYNVVPVVDSSGKIAPRDLRLPDSTSLALATLPIIGSSNAWTHPTWEHPSREAINAVRITYEAYVQYGIFSPSAQLLPKPTTIGTTFAHDTVTLFGRRQVTKRMLAVSMPYEIRLSTDSYIGLPGGANFLTRLAGDLFQRYGDGPLYSEIACSSSVDATTNGPVYPGQFVKLKVGTWPNPDTLTRGSTRVFQVVRRDVTPLGRAFRLLDVGPNQSALGAPSVALALSSQSSRHTVKATVSGLAAGAKYEINIVKTSTGTTTKPGTGASWFTVIYGSSTGTTQRIGPMASQSKYWARVRATKPLRIGSAWSTGNPNVVTASITAPSALTAGSLTGGTALLKWTNGSSQYGIEVMVDATSTATLGTTQVVDRVPAQTTRYSLVGLNLNDGHKAGVRHFDAFGGRSNQATVTFTTTTSFTAAPNLKGLVLVGGRF